MNVMHPSIRTLTFLPLLLAALLGTRVLTAESPGQPPTIEETGRGFTIEAEVPVLPGRGAAVEAANRAVRTRIDALIAAFHEARREAGAAGPVPGADWSLLIEHDPTLDLRSTGRARHTQPIA
jgi:hypothetical protein